MCDTMRRMLIPVLIGLTGITIVILLWPVLQSPASGRPRTRRRRNTNTRTTAARARTTASPARKCPVCHAPLLPGERIKSVVFSGGTAHREIQEHTTHIFGCPHCYPQNTRNPRLCPVCDSTLSRDGYLIARMFKRPGKKDHVHVLGCTECRLRGRSQVRTGNEY